MKLKNKKSPIAVILGTRPEIVKLSAILRLLEKNKKEQPYILIHTGQHYSRNMDAQFFKDLKLPQPHYQFTRPSGIGANRHSELVRAIKKNVIGVLQKELPKAILVQGDTDTVLAGAMAAREIGGIVVGHVEAGLRSYDNNMPEERNRVATDRLSHVLFAPTEMARKNLLKEKLKEKRIEVTGNTIVDAVMENMAIAQKKVRHKTKKPFALVTLHRPESVDRKERLSRVIHVLETVAKKQKIRMIFPVHPRTRQRLETFKIKLDERYFSAVEPMGFLDFLWHEKNAEIIFTDSGGVQEEACILKVPCVTIRSTTERPETIKVGANAVSGYSASGIIQKANQMLSKPRTWANPFGDGMASQRILDTLLECCSEGV